MDKMEKFRAVYRNPTARRANPALAVPKRFREVFRFTVNFPGQNNQKEPNASSKPNLESELKDFQGNTCFAKIDISHASLKIPLS